MKPLIIFDLDGTLYRGDDPFREYARVVARALDPAVAAQYLADVDAHLRGEGGIVAGDNWEAVVELARPRLEDDRVWKNAFGDIREYMLSDGCVLEVPDGLPEFIRAARAQATVICLSNSHEDSALPVLQRLGLAGAFDEVIAGAGKPAGLLAAANRLRDGDLGGAVLSVGDNYANDIAPALNQGWHTAHISPRGYFPGPSTYRGYTVEMILPDLRHWLEEALSTGGQKEEA